MTDILTLQAKRPTADEAAVQATATVGIVLKRSIARNAAENTDMWLVRTAGGVLHARCAASCLLAPAAGDTVLLAYGDRQWWIGTVLAAAARKTNVLRVPGAQQVVIAAPELHLRAQQACRLDSPVLELDTQRLEVRSRTARLAVSTLELAAHCLTAMAQRMHAFSDQIVAACRVRTVQVDEIDTLAAQHIVMTAEQTYSQQASQVLVNARDTARIDAERILMG